MEPHRELFHCIIMLTQGKSVTKIFNLRSEKENKQIVLKKLCFQGIYIYINIYIERQRGRYKCIFINIHIHTCLTELFLG